MVPVKKITQFLLLTAFIFVLRYPTLIAQTQFHASAATNCDLFSSRCLGLDLTFLYDSQWGLRLTLVHDLNYVSAIERDNSSLSYYRYSGDYEMPMLMKTLDYRVFQGESKTLFDFLTAYIAIGSTDLELTLTRNSYLASGDKLGKMTATEKISAPTNAIALGLYGGDAFLVVDFRFLYSKGKTNNGLLVDQHYDFDLWMMLFSIGFGF